MNDLIERSPISGLSNKEYHSSPGISRSSLDRLARSPAHYRAYMRGVREETPEMAFGSIVHSAILEPEEWQFVILPDDAPRRPTKTQLNAKKPSQATVDAIRWWKDFNSEADGKDILSPAEYETVCRMRDAAYSHPAAKGLFLRGKHLVEESIWWEDEYSGLLCKCRPDDRRSDGIIIDLKTTKDASSAGFVRSVKNFRYYLQAAYYMDGIKAHGLRADHWVLLAVEKTPPYAVAFYDFDPDDIALGRAQYKTELMRLAECQRADRWPAYSDKIEPLRLPDWARKQIEMEIEHGEQLY